MPASSDVLIIGSGPAGAHAALPLVEAGVQVTMLDGGLSAPPILSASKATHFEDTRREDPDQWKLFLGEDLSSIPVHGLSGGLGGGMTSGNRTYVTEGTEQHLPLQVQNGQVIQSLAKGGLGAAWGAACAYFSPQELSAMGLPPEQMQSCYEEVTREIGVSGPENQKNIQPALPLDHHGTLLLKHAQRKERTLSARHITFTQPCSAVLSRNLGERRASQCLDMDYYSNPGRSVYRPQYTIDTLERHSNFTYEHSCVIERMEQGKEGVIVHGYAMQEPDVKRQWRGKRVILAAGAVNSARILLKSLNLYDTPVPFIAKPHAFAACIHPRTLGSIGPRDRISLCQLLCVDESRDQEGLPSACAQLYSYRSMLLFRLLQSIPLPTPEAMGIAALLSPSLVIADIRFPAHRDAGHLLSLTTQQGRDALSIRCTPHSLSTYRPTLRRLYAAMRSVGLWPMKTLALPEGSSSHYAGTIPMNPDPSLPLSVDTTGSVRQMSNIFVADASVFRCLSPLPHTLTIMANARRTGKEVLSSLDR